jgi:hypothetical protein
MGIPYLLAKLLLPALAYGAACFAVGFVTFSVAFWMEYRK